MQPCLHHGCTLQTVLGVFQDSFIFPSCHLLMRFDLMTLNLTRCKLIKLQSKSVVVWEICIKIGQDFSVVVTVHLKKDIKLQSGKI